MTDQVNPKKLYVGNFPYSVTEDDLRSLFSEFGEIVSIKVITDRMTGRSKGFAFVEFVSEEAAQKAVSALNGKDMDGRALSVTVARPIVARENNGGYNDNRGGSRGGYRQNNW